MPAQIQLRGDTATNWTSVNPILAARELAIETNTGKLKLGNGSSTWSALPYFSAGGGSSTQTIAVACSDEVTPITPGNGKVTFHLPFAFTLTRVMAGLTVAQATGAIFTVDINVAGTSILSTKLTIDNTEKTSPTAATPPVISTTSLALGAEVTIDVDQIGNGSAKGLKVYLVGNPT